MISILCSLSVIKLDIFASTESLSLAGSSSSDESSDEESSTGTEGGLRSRMIKTA